MVYGLHAVFVSGLGAISCARNPQNAVYDQVFIIYESTQYQVPVVYISRRGRKIRAQMGYL